MTVITTVERRARFERLFAECHRPVRAYALRRADPDTAQDAVAETFTVAWRRLEDVPSEPLPWLMGVTRRTLANQRRSDRRAEAVATRAAVADPVVVSPDHAERLGDAAVIRQALRELSVEDREAILLIAWDGLEPYEAARVLGCTRATFAVRLHRARRRLAGAVERAERPSASAPVPVELSR